MAKKLGTIKSISGSAEVIAVDKSGNQRVLKVGDSLYEGESVKTTSADSKVVIATNNGKELSMIGEDTLALDPRATAGDSQVAALQKALLNGANLGDLEETAAGGTSGGRAGDGVSLGSASFEQGGHYSNISASTSAINPLGAASFAGPAEGKSGGLDNGGTGGGTGFYIDTTAPVVTINSINPVDTNEKADGNPDKGIVKGHSDEPNAPVVVKDKDGKIIGSGTTDDKGNFEVTTDPIKPGDKVTVEVTDKAGNTGKGDGTAGNTVYTDTTPPTVEDVKVTPVDENNPADGNPDKGIVKGHSDEPNAPVVVTKDGKTIGTGTTDDKGNFEVTTDPIKPGDKVTVEVTDKAGNTGKGDGTAGNTVYTDTTPPTVEDVKVTPVDTNEKADGNPDKGIVKGHSDEPNAPVVVTKDGKTIGTGTTDDKGNFEVTTDPIKPGDKVTVEVTDKAGNTGKGDGTAGNTVYTDTTPPTVDVETATPVDVNNPADGKADKGIVTGKSDEPNALVVITDKDGNEIGRGTTDGNGGFTIETKPFNPGDPITATVTDKAGNKGSDTENASNLTHPNDHTAPSEPTITFVEDTNPKDGKLNKAENGSDSDNANTTAKIFIPTDAVVNDVIKYTVNGEEKSHPITDADKAKGHIEVKVPVVDGKTSTVTAKIVDQAGNASKEVSDSVDVDLTIGNPKVRFLEDTDNNGVLSVAEVAAIKDGKAHWVIDIPTDGSVKAGDVIQSIDSKGNWVKFVTITDEMIKDGRFEATFNVDIEKLRNGKYETPEYRFADDAGNISDSSKATLTLDSELTRQPSNPTIKFPEDTNEDGKISDKENKEGDKDAGKTTAEISIPKDGSVKPGDKLIVTDDKGNKTVRPIEQSDIDKGSIDVPVDLNPGKDNTIIAEIVNPNNPDNPGKGKGVIGENSEATKAPEAPVITDVIDDVEGGKFNQSVKGGLTNDNTPTIKGTAKAGSKVEIYDDGNKIGETIAKPDGSWEFTTPVLTKQGEHKFTAIAKNEFGESGSSNEATIELDTIAPVIKEVTITPIDTAAKADDTAEATLIVGVTDTPHATIIAKDKDGNFLGKADANDKGGFVIDAKPVNPGDKVVFEVTDKAGNTSESEFKAGNLAHPNDHTAPKVDIDTVTPVDDTNPSDGTPDKGIVKGKSDEPNAPVVVTDENGKTIGTGTTDDKGNFEITTDPIKPGDKVKVEVTDKAGHKGSDTETAGDTEILHKDLPEAPVITEVIDDVKGYGEDTKVGNVLDVKGHLTNDKTPTIKGTAKAGSKVEIYDNGDRIGETTAKADGSWEFEAPALTKQGEHKFTATAENKFGKSTPSNEATIDLDSIAPKLDNVKITPIDTNSKADDTAELTMGTGHTDTPNAEILFRDVDNNIIGKGHANSAGDFLIQLDKAVQPGTPVFVQAIDKAGNAGTEMATAGNIEHPNDHTAPSEPTITFVEDTNPKDGKLNKDENSKDGDNANTTAKISIPTDAVVNDVIKYTVNGGTEQSHTITNADKTAGHVEIKVPVVDGQTSSVTAKIVDQAGNVGKEVSGSIDSDFTAPNVKITGIIDNVEGGVYKGNVAGTNTNDNKPTIKGTADANQEVVLYDNNKEFGRATADKDGNWEFKPSDYKEPLADLVGRVHVIKAVVTDAAGNTSEATSALEVDTTIGAPKVSIKEDVDHNGVLSVDEAKNLKDSKIHWEVEIPKDGTVSAGDVLQVLGKDGKWKIEKVLSNDDLGKSLEYEATLSGKHFESPSYRIVDLVGNQSTAIHANVQLDSEFSRQPSNPTIKFPEDTNEDGKISDKENKEGDKDAGKTTAEISIPKDGSVKPGDKLIVTDDKGNKTVRPIEQSDIDKGSIDVPVDLNPGKDNTIIAEIVNPNNPDNPGKGKGVIGENSEATKAPEAPVITDVIDDVEGGKFNQSVKGGLTNDNTPTIKGTAKAGSKVEIYDDGNKIGETIAKPDGSWEFTTPVLTKQGEHKFTATAENKFGKSTPSNEATIDLDTKTEKPVIKEIIDNVEGDTGDISSKNNWTNDNTPTLKGSAEAGADVDIYVDSKKAGSVKANDKGEWEYTTGKLSDGDHRFYVEATDKAGNTKESDIETIKVDTNPGKVVIISVTDDNGDDALNGAYEGATKDNTPTINGFAEPYSTVTVSVKDSSGKVVWSDEIYIEDSLGDWSITVDKPLNDGDYTVEASMQDYVKNPVQNSNVVSLTVDTATNIPEIKEIVDNVAGGVENGDVKGKVTNDNTPTLKGSAEAGADIKVFIDGKIAGTTKAGFDGSWDFTPRTKLSDGEHKFIVEATDKLGHSAKSIEASVDVDTTAPSVENVKVTPVDMSDPADNTPEKGRVEGSSDTPGAIVVIKDQAGKEIIGSGKVGNDGKFNIETTKPINTGDKVKVEITDDAGNTGKGEGIAGDIKHEGDFAAPCDPTITFVEDIAPKDGKLNKAENSSDSDNASTKAHISFFPDVVEGDVIKYTINNGKEQNHTVTADDVKAGYIEVKVPVVDGKTSSVTAKIVDQAGNASEVVKESISSDFTAPNTPVITAVIDEWYGGVEFDNVLGKDKGLTNDNTPKFKGTAEAGSTIVLKNGNEIIGEDIEVKANGTWEFTPKTPLADGEYNVTATATDKAGNVSNPSNVATINVDTNCAKPVITEIIDDVAGGAVNGDVKFGLTNDNLPTLKGTAEAFAEVKFMIDGRPVFKDGKQVSVTADENGKWEYTLEANSNWGGKVHVALEDGRHTFEAQATDKAGNNSQPSDVVSVDVDTTARAPKVMITADKDDNSILTATEASALTDGKLKWVIKLPEDAKVGDRIEVSNSHREWVTILTLSAADIAKGEVARDDFSADFVKGKPGFETPSYRIVDQAGNVSTEHWDTVKFDKAAPTAPVIKEVIDDHKGYDDDTRVGNVLDVKDGLTNDNMPTIKGTAEAGIKVDIYDNGKFIGTTKADANGNWNFTPSTSAALPDGKHSITAVAKNALDVESTPSNAANIDVDTVTPKPTIDKITDNVEGGVYHGDVKGGLTNDNRPVFEGSAEKGAFIELFDNDKVIGTTKAGEDGKWTIQPKEPMADGKHNMVVQATDLAGNRSRSDQTSSDVDTTSPGVVKITAVCDDVAGYNGKVGNILGVNNGLTDDSTPTIKGTAKPGVTITIKDGDKAVDGDIKYNGDGSWEFTPKTPLAEGKHELTAIATSKTGVVSNPSNVAAIDVDTKIADAKVEFIEDTNNDGKFSWKENIENTHTGRLSWKALIPDDGSIKAGDIFHYKWDETGWHERAISQAEIDRGYIGEMKNNQIDKDQPDAGKPMPYGKNANGSVYVAEAYFSDAAGNKGAKGSDKVVFDFSDNTDNKHIATTNVKITSIYDDVRGGHVGNLITNEAAQVAGLTNDKTPTISGTAEANASVKVSVVDGNLHSVWEKTITAESDGSWKVTTDNIADGNYSVTAVATNKAGAVSNPYTVSNLEIDTTIAQPNIWIKEDANQDKIYDKADYENPANGNGDITFVVDIPQDRVTIKAGDVFHYMINTNNPKWGNINGYTEDITITEADIKSGSISRVVTLCDDGKDFNMSHNGMIVSMNGYFKDLAGNALSNDTMVRFDLKNTYGGKVRSTRSLPDDILDNDSVDLSNAAHINEPKAELNVLNNNKIGVSANDLLETPKDHIMSEGKSEAKPSYATASSHAGEENIATTHPIQIEEKVESHF